MIIIIFIIAAIIAVNWYGSTSGNREHARRWKAGYLAEHPQASRHEVNKAYNEFRTALTNAHLTASDEAYKAWESRQ